MIKGDKDVVSRPEDTSLTMTIRIVRMSRQANHWGNLVIDRNSPKNKKERAGSVNTGERKVGDRDSVEELPLWLSVAVFG